MTSIVDNLCLYHCGPTINYAFPPWLHRDCHDSKRTSFSPRQQTCTLKQNTWCSQSNHKLSLVFAEQEVGLGYEVLAWLNRLVDCGWQEEEMSEHETIAKMIMLEVPQLSGLKLRTGTSLCSFITDGRTLLHSAMKLVPFIPSDNSSTPANLLLEAIIITNKPNSPHPH